MQTVNEVLQAGTEEIYLPVQGPRKLVGSVWTLVQETDQQEDFVQPTTAPVDFAAGSTPAELQMYIEGNFGEAGDRDPLD